MGWAVHFTLFCFCMYFSLYCVFVFHFCGCYIIVHYVLHTPPLYTRYVWFFFRVEGLRGV